jgi:5-methylcytosine-specific restriction endonuclease McrA
LADWQRKKAEILIAVPDRVINCQSCGTQFSTRMKAQRFCSYDCRQAGYRSEGFAHRAKTKKTEFVYNCDLCGEKIIRSTPLGGLKRYHQPDCSRIALQARYRVKTVKRQSKTVKPSGLWVEKILETYGFICYLCNDPIDMKLPRTSKRGATVDHIIPLSRGGSDELDNLRLTHWSCNMKKSDKLIEELDGQSW